MNKKVFSAAILASAAMAMTSCSSSKNAQNENATKAEKIPGRGCPSVSR